MDGNHSLVALISTLIQCENARAPFIINIVLGLPANMCVMWLILAGPGDKAAEISSLNQAICEVVICITNAIFLVALNVTIFNVVNLTYLEYTIRFSYGFIFSGRPLFLSCVCFERYLAVIHPVTFLKYKLLRYKLVGTIISWLTVLVCCIIFMWVHYSAIYYLCFSMSFSWFLVQLFCCVGILRELVRPGPGEGKQASSWMNSAKLKAFRITIVILVSDVIGYLPYTISTISHGHLSKKDSSSLFCIATYIAIVTGFIPPLLYFHKAGKLQHCFRHTATRS